MVGTKTKSLLSDLCHPNAILFAKNKQPPYSVYSWRGRNNKKVKNDPQSSLQTPLAPPKSHLELWFQNDHPKIRDNFPSMQGGGNILICKLNKKSGFENIRNGFVFCIVSILKGGRRGETVLEVLLSQWNFFPSITGTDTELTWLCLVLALVPLSRMPGCGCRMQLLRHALS